MKRTRILLKCLAACVVAFAVASQAMAQSVNERTGKVVRIKGRFARYSMGNDVWQPLKVGTVLKPGALVQTGMASSVEIALGEPENVEQSSSTKPQGKRKPAERHVVRLAEDSVLVIARLTTVEKGNSRFTETRLHLRSGKIQGSPKTMSPGSRYEVRFPNGVTSIHGTSYAISADGVILGKNLL